MAKGIYSFGKQERLCSNKLIDELYTTGNRLRMFPFSVYWMACDESALPAQAQVLISVSKRKFHNAVDRNRVKRLVRECYRQCKPQLYAALHDKGIGMIMAISYFHNEILDCELLMQRYEKMVVLLERSIVEEIQAKA